MHRKVVDEPEDLKQTEISVDEQLKDVEKSDLNSFNSNNFIAISKSKPVENQKSELEDKNPACDEAAVNSSVDELRSRNADDISQREISTSCFKKSSDDNSGLELYDNENLKNDYVDDEETVLINEISKILVTRDTNRQNERVSKFSTENSSSKEAKVINLLESESSGIKLVKKRALIMVDVFLSVAVVAPLVVSYWQGLWMVIDLHHDIFPAHVCFVLGMSIHAIFAILKNHLHAKFAQELKAQSISARFCYRLVRMFYTYIFSTGCIMHWRGAWIIFDHYVKGHNWFVYCATAVFVLILLLGRCVRNLIAPPYWVAIDKRGYVFQFPTRFKTKYKYSNLVSAQNALAAQEL